MLLQMPLQHLAAALGMTEIDEYGAGPFDMRWTESWHCTALQRMGVIDVVDDVVTVPEPLCFVMLNAVGAIIASLSAFRR